MKPLIFSPDRQRKLDHPQWRVMRAGKKIGWMYYDEDRRTFCFDALDTAVTASELEQLAKFCAKAKP